MSYITFKETGTRQATKLWNIACSIQHPAIVMHTHIHKWNVRNKNSTVTKFQNNEIAKSIYKQTNALHLCLLT